MIAESNQSANETARVMIQLQQPQLLDRSRSYSNNLPIENLIKAKDFESQLLFMLSDNSFPFIKKRYFTDHILKFTTRFQVLIPQNTFLIVWNSIILFIIIYYLFQVGLLWAYGQQVWQDQLRYLFFPSIFFILILAADIFVSLLKGYYHHGLLILSHRQIVKRYMRKLILIDVIGLIGIIISFATQSYVLNWFKVLFIPKIYNAYLIDKEFLQMTQSNSRMHFFYVLIKLLLLYCLWSHYIGIWFFMIDNWVYKNNYYGPNTPQVCWIYNCQAYSQIIILLPWTGQYLYTMYFSLGTMNTIAYGDITPLNPLETIYITIALYFYTIGFAYILSSIIEVVFQAQAAQMQHTNTLLVMNNLMNEEKITAETKGKVASYYETIWKEQRYRDRETERQMINNLPVKVRNQLYIHIYKDFMSQLGIQMYNKDNIKFSQLKKQIMASSWKIPILSQFVSNLLENIREQRRNPGQIIFRPGQIQDQTNDSSASVYYARECIRIGFHNIDAQKHALDINCKTVKSITGIFGQQSFLTGAPRYYWASPTSSTVLYIISRRILMQSLSLATTQQMEKYLMLRDTVQKKKCLICEVQNQHNTRKCPYIVYKPLAVEIINKRKQKQIAELKESENAAFSNYKAQMLANSSILNRQDRKKLSSLKMFKEQSNQIYKMTKKTKQKLMISQSYYMNFLNDSQSQSSQGDSESEEDLDTYMIQTQMLIKSFLKIANSKKSQGIQARDDGMLKSRLQRKMTMIKSVSSHQSSQNNAQGSKITHQKLIGSVNQILEELNDEIDQAKNYQHYFPEYNLLAIIKKKQEIMKDQVKRRKALSFSRPKSQ